MALMLVSGAALLLRSFVNLLNVDTGFARDGVMVMQMFAWDRNPGPDGCAASSTRRLGRVARDAWRASGRRSAGDAVHRIEHRHPGHDAHRREPAPAPGEELRASFNVATPGYFA